MTGSSSEGSTVLVVGAGIGGLTAALCLSRIGYRVHLIEQAPELTEVGAGIQLGPNVFKMFDLLGIKQDIDVDAVFPDQYRILDIQTGEELTHLPLGDSCLRRYGYRYGVAHRHDLHRVLVEACRADGNIQFTLNQQVVGFEEAGDKVIVKTAGGARFEGDALIGADGLRSRIRETLMRDTSDPISSGLMAARAVPNIEDVPEEVRQHRITIWLGPKCHMIYYPLRAGRLLNLAAVFEPDVDMNLALADPDWDMQAALQRVYGTFHPTVRKLLPYLEERRYVAATERVATKNWSRGRTTLLGDAAHAMTQNMAQGGCMAIEDAVVLADKMINCGDNLEAAFLAYQEARYLRTARVQFSARFYGQVMHVEGAERDLRNAIFRSLDPRANLEAFAWLYDGVQVTPAARSALRKTGSAVRERGAAQG